MLTVMLSGEKQVNPDKALDFYGLNPSQISHNSKDVESADAVIVNWNGESRKILESIKKAIRNNVAIYLYPKNM